MKFFEKDFLEFQETILKIIENFSLCPCFQVHCPNNYVS